MSAAENIPIVLLPGMDGTGELLAGLVAQLSRQRPVQVVSYPTDQLLGYDALTALVLARVPKGRFVILGESFSGPIAIELAASEPQRVAGLVLASSFARSPAPGFLAPFARRLDLRWAPRWAIEAALLGASGTPALRASLHKVLSKLPREVIRLRAAEVLRVDKRERLRAVACPILCLQGRFDRLAGKKCLDGIARAQPGCDVRWFDAPHMLLEAHAQEAAEAINAFCARVS